MEAYQRQQFDMLLIVAAERFVERIVQRCEGSTNALERLRTAPQGEGVWLDEFVRLFFQDMLLDNPAGACFVLQALPKRRLPALPAGSIEMVLQQAARCAFADLLRTRVEEALEQQLAYGG